MLTVNKCNRSPAAIVGHIHDLRNAGLIPSGGLNPANLVALLEATENGFGSVEARPDLVGSVVDWYMKRRPPQRYLWTGRFITTPDAIATN